MSLSEPSHVSATTGSDQSYSLRLRACFTSHSMTASRTTPTECVFVIITGPHKKPDSSSQVVPVISPLPLSVNQPAKTGSPERLPRGRTAVTPVRTGPFPTTSLPLPETSVACPTSTPATSVMASSGPGVPSSGIRRSRARSFCWVAVAGRWGPLLFMICLIGGGLWLVARDMRAHGSRLRSRVFLGMLGESLALALAFGIVVGGITSGVIGLLQTLALASSGDLTWWTRLMVSLGAGIYEELLFRVLLVTALSATARAVFGWTPVAAGVAATVLGAAIFSAFHYLGPYGDRLQVYSFVFRMIAGLFFSALYLLRGFGITAWTHALYDVSLLILS